MRTRSPLLKILQDSSKGRNFQQCVAITELALHPRERAVVDQGNSCPLPSLHMAIQRIPTGVAGRIGEPTPVDACLGIKNFLRRSDPINLFGRFSPKIERITLPSSIGFGISANHVTSHSVFVA